MVVWPSRRSRLPVLAVAAVFGLAACATTPGPTNPVQNPNQSRVGVAMVTHANWSRIDGERGHAERDVTLTDVSRNGDWSAVRMWYRDMDGLGSTTYPVYGFIYGTPATQTQPRAKAAPELSGRDPDYVGALIDAYVR